MKNHFLKHFAFFCVVASCCAYADSPAIQVVGSWAKEGHGTNTPRGVVQFGVQDISAPGGLASEAAIELESTCKNRQLIHVLQLPCVPERREKDFERFRGNFDNTKSASTFSEQRV